MIVICNGTENTGDIRACMNNQCWFIRACECNKISHDKAEVMT